MQKLKYRGGKCRHLSGGCSFTGKTPKTLLMKEHLLMVSWKIIPLEEEHLSGLTYTLFIVLSSTMSARSRCRRKQVGCEEHWMGSTGLYSTPVCVPMGMGCPPKALWTHPLQLLVLSWPWWNMRDPELFRGQYWLASASSTKFITLPELLQSSTYSFCQQVFFPDITAMKGEKGNRGWILLTFFPSPGSGSCR